MISLSALVMCLVVAGLTYILLIVYDQFFYWKRRGVLHINIFPLLGINAPTFFRLTAYPLHSKKLYDKYPNALYYGTFDFNTPVIVVRDPTIIRDVCIKSFDNFPDHRNFVTEEMDPIVGRNVFSLRGQRWREVRSTLSPSFTANKMKVMFEVVSEASKQFAQYFMDNPEISKELEVKDAVTRYTNDVIATAAFGLRVNSLLDQENEFYMRGKDATSFSSPLRLMKFILFRTFPAFMRMIGETFLSRSTDRFFKRLIMETVRTREAEGIDRPDMIQLLMQAKNKAKITNDDIIGQAFIFFLAGFDTASTLMCFLIFELAVNPDIQDRVRQEIDEMLLETEDDELTYEMLSKMKYLDMVINETLRMYPPAPITDRVCVKEFVLPPASVHHVPYRVEVGTSMLIPIYGLHRDPKYFPEPDHFVPDRFSDENKDNINPYVYMPFGLGPRKCIGNRFALMETKALIVEILKKFKIKRTPKTVYPPVFCKKAFNMSVKDGLWVRFVDRFGMEDF